MKPRLPKPSPRLLFESALIIASVALGFAVTEWRERAADRALSRRILTNVVAEIRANREWLAAQIPRHTALVEAVKRAPVPAAEQSGWEALTNTIKEGSGALPLRRAAWDAAVSSGALRLIDYDIAARLSDIYAFQEDGYGRASRGLGESLFVPETFKPGHAKETLLMFRAMLGELLGQETYMLDVYERHLPALQAEAAR